LPLACCDKFSSASEVTKRIARKGWLLVFL